jgi:hypothetical protein
MDETGAGEAGDGLPDIRDPQLRLARDELLVAIAQCDRAIARQMERAKAQLHDISDLLGCPN